MPRPSAQSNLQTYDAPEVAAHYASLHYLTPGEQLLFESYIHDGANVLDLGVGGGRTTSYLAKKAGHYVGVDYAAAMVQACQRKFPDLKFIVSDASDLSMFADAEFDAVVFAFNGIDYVFPEDSRVACLRHVHRILKHQGVFIFSTHNPKAVLVRKSINQERMRRLARLSSGGAEWLEKILRVSLAGAGFVWSVVRSALATLPRFWKRIFTRAFWSGEGEFVDSSHGGLLTHSWTPGYLVDQMNALHFRFERVLANDYPRPVHQYATDWYYYVFAKR